MKLFGSMVSKLLFHTFGVLAVFEHSLIRERTVAGLEEARGRKGVRKPVISESDIRKATAMLVDPKSTKKEIAEHFAISRTTLNASLWWLTQPMELN